MSGKSRPRGRHQFQGTELSFPLLCEKRSWAPSRVPDKEYERTSAGAIDWRSYPHLAFSSTT